MGHLQGERSGSGKYLQLLIDLRSNTSSINHYFVATLRLLLPKTDIDLQVFICCWFVAGEADRDGDGLWPHHQRSLGDDHLPRLEVPGGHQVPPDVRGAADLVGAALGLVDLPVELLVLPGAIKDAGAASAALQRACFGASLPAHLSFHKYWVN